MNLTTVLFDFDGVICHDHFYLNFRDIYPQVYDFIQCNIFNSGNDLHSRWMRNEITSNDINRMISRETNIDFEIISSLFIRGIHEMEIDQRLITFAQNLKKNGIKTAIITDNMDVFSTIIVKNHSLYDTFPVIINSADHQLLKNDDNGRLFDIALQELDHSNFEDTLFIDNSPHKCELFEKRGGTSYLYTDFENLKLWASQNNLLESPRPVYSS